MNTVTVAAVVILEHTVKMVIRTIDFKGLSLGVAGGTMGGAIALGQLMVIIA